MIFLNTPSHRGGKLRQAQSPALKPYRAVPIGQADAVVQGPVILVGCIVQLPEHLPLPLGPPLALDHVQILRTHILLFTFGGWGGGVQMMRGVRRLIAGRGGEHR